MYVCVCIYMPLPRGFQNKKVFVLLTPVFNFSRDYRFYCYLMFLFFFFDTSAFLPQAVVTGKN